MDETSLVLQRPLLADRDEPSRSECQSPPSAGLCQRLRAARLARGLTLQALAAAVGCGKSYLSQIEHGRNAGQVSSELLARAELALGLAAGALVGTSELAHAGPSVRDALERERQQRAAAQAQLARVSLRGGGVSLDSLYKSGALHALAGQAAPEGASAGGGASASMLSARGLPSQAQALGARALGLRARVARALDSQVWSSDALEPVRLAGRVPIVNRLAAGLPREFGDLGYPARVADAYHPVEGAGDPDAFACRVVGDSMVPGYVAGDVVVFWPSRVARHGADCFVRLERDERTTFKRVFFMPEPPAESVGEGGSAYAWRDSSAEDAAGAGKADHDLAAWSQRVTHVRLVALNPAYGERVLAREDVAAIYPAVSVTRAVGGPG